jgi:nicotinamidase-related amidase
MLNDFVYGNLKFERATRIIAKVKLLLDSARAKNIPILYCNDQHLISDAYELELWGKHAMKGTVGSRIIDELKPLESDLIVYKRKYSSFDGTSLNKLLAKMYNRNGANTLIMTGIHTHICVQHTVYDAFVKGYKIIVVEDGVNAFTEADHLQGLRYMKEIYGVKIEKTSKILNIIRSIS